MELWCLIFYFLSEVRKQIDLHRKIEFMDCDVRWKYFLIQSKLKSEGFPWVLKVLLVIELSCTKICREMHAFKSCRAGGVISLCAWIDSVFFSVLGVFFPFFMFLHLKNNFWTGCFGLVELVWLSMRRSRSLSISKYLPSYWLGLFLASGSTGLLQLKSSWFMQYWNF